MRYKLLFMAAGPWLMTIVATAALTETSFSAGGDQKTEPKVAMKVDGDDLIASVEVRANNSPHAL